MLRKTIISLTFLVFLFSCSNQEKQKDLAELRPVEKQIVDIQQIKERGRLVALTDFSSSSYFIYKGVPMGFEYELLERFCAFIDVDLSIKIVENMDAVTSSLNNLEGDVIAANYTITNHRKKDVAFTVPVLQTRQVLVQKMPDQWWTMTRDQLDKSLVRNPTQMLGKTIHVRRKSSFYTRLLSLMDEIGGVINVKFVKGIGTEKLIEMVSQGEINYTLADENIALLNKGYYPNIDVRTPMSFNQNIAWACRKDSPELLEAFDAWLENFKKTEEFAVIYLKYFKARTQHKQRVLSEYSSLKGSKISPYDAMIKEQAERLGWDWKLLAAMIYQESRFVPDAEAWTGASGLMQLIPETARRFGADSLSDPQQNIRAGVSFLSTLKTYWTAHLQDSTQIIPFSLASYNVGLGHVLDAQRLAEKHSSSKEDWEDVARYLELKSQPQYFKDEVVRHGYCRGAEPVNYVKDIMLLWEHYKNTPI